MNKNLNTTEIYKTLQIDKELIDNIINLIEENAKQSLLNIFSDLHPADIAEIINNLSFEEANYTFNILPISSAYEVITELDENLRDKILEETSPEKISKIINELDSDDATDIISNLPDELKSSVLRKIDSESLEDVTELMKYPEDTAGGLMETDFVFIREDATVADAINEIRENAEEIDHLFYIHVLSKTNRLIGIVGLKSLLTNNPDEKITNIMEEDLIFVTPDVDQEEVASIMEKYDLVSIPVVDENKVMLGRITIDDIVDVINEEASEDIQLIAGLSEEQETSDSVFRISRIRLPWLLIALILEIGASKLLHFYEGSLSNFTTAVVYIPIIMALGGSSGQQAAIVMVKSISLNPNLTKFSFVKIIKEFFVGLTNGLISSAILLLGSFIFLHNDLNKLLIVSLALLATIISSTMIGFSVPILLKKFNVDPAIATGPFVSASNDIFGIFVYFTIFNLLLPVL